MIQAEAATANHPRRLLRSRYSTWGGWGNDVDEHLRAKRPDLEPDSAHREEKREDDRGTWPGKRSLTDALASQPRGQTGTGWPGRNALVNAFFPPAAAALPRSMREELEKLYGGPATARTPHGDQLALTKETLDAGALATGSEGSASSDAHPATGAAKADDKATPDAAPTPNADRKGSAQHATWQEQRDPDARREPNTERMDVRSRARYPDRTSYSHLEDHKLHGNRAAGIVAKDAQPAREQVPSRRTRVVTELAVQRKESSDSEETVDDVHEAAQEGISGSSGSLPFLDQIQRWFGEHDISDVRAHTDSSAAKGAKRMSAEAYATGNRVVFGGAPNLHTAAHEAAHVVQQRANLQLNGGVGKAGDRFEKHADAVADRVVRGQSAQDLLDVFAPRTARASSTAVQLKPDDKAPKPAGKAKAKPPAPEVMPPQVDPASRPLTMDQASDPKSAKDVDTEWINSLPEHVRTSIDGAFSDTTADEAVDKAAKADAGLKQIQTETNAAIAALKAETRTRLQNGNAKARISESQITADTTYKDALAKLANSKAERIAARKHEIANDRDASMDKGKRNETVLDPTTPKIKRAEGKAIARANFMSWAISIFGSADAVKAHFMGIQQVDTATHRDMWLSSEAAARFRAALKDFEDKHQGQTIVRTGTAMQSRHLHEGRQGIGMDGHALGIAFDLHATKNPNIKYQPHENDPADSYDYFLRTFGADAAGNKGRARMSLSPSAGHKTADASIEALGKDTVANTPHEANDMGNKAGDQYDEMFQTSENFKSNNAAMTERLREIRDDYFNLNLEDLKKTHAGLVKSLKHPEAYIAQQLKAEGFKGTKEDKAKRIEAITKDLADQVQKSQQNIATKDGQVRDALKGAFGDWLKQIQKDKDADDAQITKNTTSMNGMNALTDQLAAIDASGPMAMDALESFATQNKLTLKDQLTAKQNNPKGYKAKLQKDLEAGQKDERSRVTMKGDAKVPGSTNTGTEYAQNEEKVLERWEKRLVDPKFVFGTSKGKDGAGHWTTDTNVASVALMQLLENGFVEKTTKVAAPGNGREEVFNREVVETLVRFGFSPGATYGDTMHFDFIEGSSLATKGGRSNANMSPKRFGPVGKKGQDE
ncbi:hypothetical protein BH11MYX2_BH11MYX2_10200 [soil metagenome]